MSATYRQASKITSDHDPKNIWLARGSRQRLAAESVRDNALFVSGLYVERMGGPSVKPHQPDGLWTEVSGKKYVPDVGEKLYRRSLYTFFKRTVAPPIMATFDSAGREMCSVRKSLTNTPSQALVLLNSRTFIEAARVLAERTMLAESTPDARVKRMFRQVTSRMPTDEELTVIHNLIHQQSRRYKNDPQATKDLLENSGPYPRISGLPESDVAVYTVLANLLLNLDEVVTKQ